MIKSTNEIRHMFLNFFLSKDHQIIDGSSLIPKNDSTLLFTNAGMNQFKNIFLGFEKIHYPRIATSQRCVRVGGKHNDLEKVGYTSHHHTFFEMLGNFSFGDYFKHEAIQYAWELLTNDNWFNLPKERLLITVYENDNESYDIWKKKIGVLPEQIIRIGDKEGIPYSSDNFWKMADTGPCGPSTEIFYDCSNQIFGKFSENYKKNSNNRYIEIWNIVFMQFNRKADGSMEILPKPSVDTGMGLERISSVLQCVNSNYEIDSFRTLIQAIMKVIDVTKSDNKSLYIIADHIRCCAFLIADGVIPSNENRGYVLRRIIRRAVRHGRMLGIKNIFFYKLVNPLMSIINETWKEIKYKKKKIETILKIEEEQFAHILERGLVLLHKELKKLKGNTLDGKTAFLLHDTYGFPIDLTEEICYEQNIKVDKINFEIEMNKQRCRARKLNIFHTNYDTVYINNTSEFYGYSHLELNAYITALFVDGKEVKDINPEQEAIIFLNKTPFYSESGGQVGDKGELKNFNFIFKVNDTKKYGQAIGHIGQLTSSNLKIGDNVQAIVDKSRRTRICLNHSATHLMRSALSKVLGVHISQKGSLINDKILRFDFSHFRAINLTEIYKVEDLVNEQIRLNLPIDTKIMDLEEAKAEGITTFFEEKYSKHIRIVSIGNFSIEPCIGTHASHTGNIGLFRIISEFSVAAGIRRIEAITGDTAITSLHDQNNQLYNIRKLLKSNSYNLNDKICNILKRSRQIEKELLLFKKQIVKKESINLSKKAIEIKKTKLLVSKLSDIEPKMFRMIIDNLKTLLGSSVIVLATVSEDRLFFSAGVSKDIVHVVKANELINMILKKINGKGGGCPDLAQASGIDTSALSSTLSIIEDWLTIKLQTL